MTKKSNKPLLTADQATTLIPEVTITPTTTTQQNAGINDAFSRSIEEQRQQGLEGMYNAIGSSKTNLGYSSIYEAENQYKKKLADSFSWSSQLMYNTTGWSTVDKSVKAFTELDPKLELQPMPSDINTYVDGQMKYTDPYGRDQVLPDIYKAKLLDAENMYEFNKNRNAFIKENNMNMSFAAAHPTLAQTWYGQLAYGLGAGMTDWTNAVIGAGVGAAATAWTGPGSVIGAGVGAGVGVTSKAFRAMRALAVVEKSGVEATAEGMSKALATARLAGDSVTEDLLKQAIDGVKLRGRVEWAGNMVGGTAIAYADNQQFGRDISTADFGEHIIAPTILALGLHRFGEVKYANTIAKHTNDIPLVPKQNGSIVSEDMSSVNHNLAQDTFKQSGMTDQSMGVINFDNPIDAVGYSYAKSTDPVAKQKVRDKLGLTDTEADTWSKNVADSFDTGYVGIKDGKAIVPDQFSTLSTSFKKATSIADKLGPSVKAALDFTSDKFENPIDFISQKYKYADDAQKELIAKELGLSTSDMEHYSEAVNSIYKKEGKVKAIWGGTNNPHWAVENGEFVIKAGEHESIVAQQNAIIAKQKEKARLEQEVFAAGLDKKHRIDNGWDLTPNKGDVNTNTLSSEEFVLGLNDGLVDYTVRPSETVVEVKPTSISHDTIADVSQSTDKLPDTIVNDYTPDFVIVHEDRNGQVTPLRLTKEPLAGDADFQDKAVKPTLLLTYDSNTTPTLSKKSEYLLADDYVSYNPIVESFARDVMGFGKDDTGLSALFDVVIKDSDLQWNPRLNRWEADPEKLIYAVINKSVGGSEYSKLLADTFASMKDLSLNKIRDKYRLNYADAVKIRDMIEVGANPNDNIAYIMHAISTDQDAYKVVSKLLDDKGNNVLELINSHLVKTTKNEHVFDSIVLAYNAATKNKIEVSSATRKFKEVETKSAPIVKDEVKFDRGNETFDQSRSTTQMFLKALDEYTPDIKDPQDRLANRLGPAIGQLLDGSMSKKAFKDILKERLALGIKDEKETLKSLLNEDADTFNNLTKIRQLSIDSISKLSDEQLAAKEVAHLSDKPSVLAEKIGYGELSIDEARALWKTMDATDPRRDAVEVVLGYGIRRTIDQGSDFRLSVLDGDIFYEVKNESGGWDVVINDKTQGYTPKVDNVSYIRRPFDDQEVARLHKFIHGIDGPDRFNDGLPDFIAEATTEVPIDNALTWLRNAIEYQYFVKNNLNRGMSVKVIDYLRELMKDSDIKIYMHEDAKWNKAVGRGTGGFYRAEGSVDEVHLPAELFGYYADSSGKLVRKDQIGLDPSNFIHEMVHAITVRKLESVEAKPVVDKIVRGIGKLDDYVNSHGALSDVELGRAIIKDLGLDVKGKRIDDYDAGNLAHYLKYATTDHKEFIAVALQEIWNPNSLITKAFNKIKVEDTFDGGTISLIGFIRKIMNWVTGSTDNHLMDYVNDALKWVNTNKIKDLTGTDMVYDKVFTRTPDFNDKFMTINKKAMLTAALAGGSTGANAMALGSNASSTDDGHPLAWLLGGAAMIGGMILTKRHFPKSKAGKLTNWFTTSSIKSKLETQNNKSLNAWIGSLLTSGYGSNVGADNIRRSLLEPSVAKIRMVAQQQAAGLLGLNAISGRLKSAQIRLLEGKYIELMESAQRQRVGLEPRTEAGDAINKAITSEYKQLLVRAKQVKETLEKLTLDENSPVNWSATTSRITKWVEVLENNADNIDTYVHLRHDYNKFNALVAKFGGGEEGLNAVKGYLARNLMSNGLDKSKAEMLAEAKTHAMVYLQASDGGLKHVTEEDARVFYQNLKQLFADQGKPITDEQLKWVESIVGLLPYKDPDIGVTATRRRIPWNMAYSENGIDMFSFHESNTIHTFEGWLNQFAGDMAMATHTVNEFNKTGVFRNWDHHDWVTKAVNEITRENPLLDPEDTNFIIRESYAKMYGFTTTGSPKIASDSLKLLENNMYAQTAGGFFKSSGTEAILHMVSNPIISLTTLKPMIQLRQGILSGKVTSGFLKELAMDFGLFADTYMHSNKVKDQSLFKIIAGRNVGDMTRTELVKDTLSKFAGIASSVTLNQSATSLTKMVVAQKFLTQLAKAQVTNLDGEYRIVGNTRSWLNTWEKRMGLTAKEVHAFKSMIDEFATFDPSSGRLTALNLDKMMLKDQSMATKLVAYTKNVADWATGEGTIGSDNVLAYNPATNLALHLFKSFLRGFERYGKELVDDPASIEAWKGLTISIASYAVSALAIVALTMPEGDPRREQYLTPEGILAMAFSRASATGAIANNMAIIWSTAGLTDPSTPMRSRGTGIGIPVLQALNSQIGAIEGITRLAAGKKGWEDLTDQQRKQKMWATAKLVNFAGWTLPIMRNAFDPESLKGN